MRSATDNQERYSLADRRDGKIRTKSGRKDPNVGSLSFTTDDARRELKDKDLVCWRKPGAVLHGDLLLPMPTIYLAEVGDQ